ncbi:hypothetical protein Q5P01_023354 [Channa striata]|uniref:HMG box domain-containing protein n=1 Tax=Channa striata TaxID=64152 RepID=A0AA88IUQ1_CHASR|nr:hypothetical protein Q5P01_023354 [Channa striata]
MRTDVRAEFDRVIKQMEWGEVLDTLQDVIGDALGVTPEPVPTTPPPPALPAELEHDIRFEAVGEVHEVHVGCSSHHLGIAPHISDAPNVMHTDPLYCQQAGVHSQEQHALYESAVYDHPGSTTAAYYPAAPPHTYNDTPLITVIENTAQNLVPLRLANGEVVYAYTLHSNSAVPLVPSSILKKRKRKYNKPHDEDQPYIKKPLNAFMLFLKEQRQNVVAEIKIRDNATVNCILGQRWALLSQDEKAKYYEQAEKEKLLHAMQNPGWSSSDNYGKKRKRQRRKTPTAAESPETEHYQQQIEQISMETLTSALEMPHAKDMDALFYSSDKVPWNELFLSSPLNIQMI